MDTPLAREHVYGAVASRALHRLAHPPRRHRSTLAEYLGSRGYATAGFAANYWYCASDSGLGGGFVTYQDYIFPRPTALKTAVLVKGFLDGLRSVDRFLDDWLDLDFVRPAVGVLSWLFEADQKTAAVVNGEFLEWLARGNPNGRSSPS